MKVKNILIGTLIITALVRCGAAGTESNSTGNGLGGSSTVSSQIKEIAGSLVPEFSNSSSSSLSKHLTYAEDSDWSTYLEESNQVYLSDIFGANEGQAPVTRIRVLLDEFENNYDQITSLDPDLDCSGSSRLVASTETEIPFLDNVVHESLSDQALDCYISISDSNAKILYGQDDSGVTRIVFMSEDTSANTESVESRGEQRKLMQVIQATVTEQERDGINRAYLDLNYAQATIYSGANDNTFGTSDDIVFKSRSRITGTVQLDEDGEVVSGSALGEYTVLKYDAGVDEFLNSWNSMTQVIGRGQDPSTGFTLFKIHSTAGSLSDAAGTFCLANSEGTLPSLSDEENCVDWETGFAWATLEFPFELTMERDFDDKEFFGEDHLIDNDGSNFEIPEYTLVSDSE